MKPEQELTNIFKMFTEVQLINNIMQVTSVQ